MRAFAVVALATGLSASTPAFAGGLYTGGWEHTVPIDLPPAPRGTAPTLSLTADHQAAEGVLGRGWRLDGFSSITRVSETKGVPAFDGPPVAGAGTTDLFLVDGEELVEDDQGTCEYRLLHDTNQCFDYNPTTGVWTAKRDGWTWTWGMDAFNIGNMPVPTHAIEWALEDADDVCGTWSMPGTYDNNWATEWHLTSVEDPSGNRIEYIYDSPCATIGGGGVGSIAIADHAFEHVPDEIWYNNREVIVDFEYDDRADPISSSRTGNLRAMTQRLTDIEVKVNRTGSYDGDVITHYELAYLESSSTQCPNSTEPVFDPLGATLLQRIQRVDVTDASHSRVLRCMEYSDDGSGWDPESVLYSENGVGPMELDAEFMPMAVNFDGDAWPDILVSFEFYFWHSLSEGADPAATGELDEDNAFAAALDAFGVPSGDEFDEDDDARLLFDIDRDGATELLVVSCASPGDSCGVIAEYDPSTGSVVDSGAALDLDPLLLQRAQPADVDGDGFADLVIRPDWSSAIHEHEWIRNSGEDPWFDESDLAPLPLPLDEGSTSAAMVDLNNAWLTCETLGAPSGDYELLFPPGMASVQRSQYSFVELSTGLPDYADEFEFAANQARFVDVNADGIMDVAYSVWPCWEVFEEYASSAVEDVLPVTDVVGLEPISAVYVGDGRGGFVETLIPAGLPWVDRNEIVEWEALDPPDDHDTLWWETTWGSAFAWVGADYVAAMDLDRDGRVDWLHDAGDIVRDMSVVVTQHMTAGTWSSTPWRGLDEASCVPWRDGVNEATGPCASGVTAMPYSMAFGTPITTRRVNLPVDWNGDGFTDLLSVQKPSDFYTLEGAEDDFQFDFAVSVRENTQSTSRARLERIHTSRGGVVELAYTWSLDWFDNENSPVGVEVIRSVEDATGQTEYAFEGLRFVDGRPRGFRDAIVAKEPAAGDADNRYDTWRFAQSEVFGGMPIYKRSVDDSGDLVALDVWLPLDELSGSHVFDAMPPYFNPVRRSCSFEFQPDGIPYLTGDSIEECNDFGSTWPSLNMFAFSVAMGWEDEGGAALLENKTWRRTEASVATVATALTTPTVAPRPWCAAVNDPGSGTSEFIDDCASLPPFPPPPSPTLPSEVGSWKEYMAPLATPGTPRTRDRKLYVQDTTFTADQRVDTATDWRDADTALDDIETVYSWLTWDSTHKGVQLSSKTINRLSDGHRLRKWVYSTYAGFDRARNEYEEGDDGSSRTWSRTWTNGEVASVTEPDGGTTSFTRNRCGQLVSKTDAAGRVESRGHDVACRLTSRSFLGATETLTRDGFGRVATRVVDSGLSDATPMRESWFYEDEEPPADGHSGWSVPSYGVRYGDASDSTAPVEVWFEDEWGRTSKTTRCAGDVAGYWPTAMAIDSTSTVGDALGCSDGTERHQFQAYGLDGRLRVQTPTYATGEVAPTVWTFFDGANRMVSRLDPAPIAWPADDTGRDWVETTFDYALGKRGVRDPEGTICTTSSSTVAASMVCGGTTLSQVDIDLLGALTEVEDADGRVVSLERDGFGRVKKERVEGSFTLFEDFATASSTDLEWTRTWTPGGRLDTETDPGGNVSDWDYDSVGRPTSVDVDPIDGPPETVSEWTYTELLGGGSSTSFTDLNGNVWSSKLDGLGRLVERIHPDGTSDNWSFDAQGFVAAHVTRDGWWTTRSYDAHGRLEAIAGYSAPGTPDWEELYDHDVGEGLAEVIDPDGVVTTLESAWNGQVLSTSQPNPDGGTWILSEYSYDDRGLVVSESVAGVHSSFTYDTLGRLASACRGTTAFGDTTGCSQTQTYAWSDAGQLESETWDGLTASYGYDDRGLRTSVTHPDSTTESWLYDFAGRLTRHTDEAGLVSQWDFDGMGRLEDEQLPGMGGARSWIYSSGVSPTYVPTSGMFVEGHEVTEPDGAVWETWYDFEGRVARIARPDDTAMQYTYTGSQLSLIAHEDCIMGSCSAEAWELFEYDGVGRLSLRYGPMGPADYNPSTGAVGDFAVEKAWQWTPAGRMASVAVDGTDETAFSYTEGVLTSEEVFGLYERVLTYDADAPRVVLEQRYEEGLTSLPGTGSTSARSASWAYDRLSRVTEQRSWWGTGTAPSGAHLVSQWDNFDEYGTPLDEASYELPDGVTQTNPSYRVHALSRDTDLRGRLTTVDVEVGGSDYGTLTYGWTNNGRLSALSFQPDGASARNVQYVRNAALQVSSIFDSGASGTIVDVVGRDSMGRIEDLVLADGQTASIGWDALGRMASLDVELSDGSLAERTYEYDARGRMEARGVAFTDTAGDQSGLQTTMYYDEPGWLTDEVVWSWEDDGSGGTIDTFQSWERSTYDGSGNREVVELLDSAGSTVLSATTYGYDIANRVTDVDGVSVTWDEMGGIAEDHRGWEFLRGPDGRVQGLTNPAGTASVDIYRDAAGRPIHTIDTDGTSHVRVWDHPMGPWPAAGDDDGEERMWVSLEGLLVARLDGTTDVVAAMTDAQGSLALFGDELLEGASAWGTEVDTPETKTARYAYAGLEMLPGTPFQQAWHRVYDPELGRFMSADPIGLSGGPHRFRYAENRPAGMVDPEGLSAHASMDVVSEFMGAAYAAELWMQQTWGADAGFVPSAGGGPIERCSRSSTHCDQPRLPPAQMGSGDENGDGEPDPPTGDQEDPPESCSDSDPKCAEVEFEPVLVVGKKTERYWTTSSANNQFLPDDQASPPPGQGGMSTGEFVLRNGGAGTLSAMGDHIDGYISATELNGLPILDTMLADWLLGDLRDWLYREGDSIAPQGSQQTASGEYLRGSTKIAAVVFFTVAEPGPGGESGQTARAFTRLSNEVVEQGPELTAKARTAARNAVSRAWDNFETPGCFVAGTALVYVGSDVVIEDVQTGDWIRTTSQGLTSPALLARNQVVWALGAEGGPARLDQLRLGTEVLLGNHVFTVAVDAHGNLYGVPTGDRFAPVTATFVRSAPVVIDAEILHPDGAVDVLTGTPNHPFWVPALQDFVALSELAIGTELHTEAGGSAILIGKTWRQGDFEVFDVEVEGLHRFYVRGSDGGAPAVLVHNSKGKKAVPGPELVATENGSVVVKGEDYYLTDPKTDDFLDINGGHDHGGLGAASGIDFHTHRPVLTIAPEGRGVSKVERKASSTTAADLDEAAERVRSGELVSK